MHSNGVHFLLSTVVKASDIAFSSPVQALFVENIGTIKVGKNPINTNSANALYQLAMTAWKANPKMTADEAMSLIKGLEESYIYGAYNLGRSKLTTRNEDGTARLFAGELSQEQRKFAYELGTKDSVSKAEADQRNIDELKAKADHKPTKKTPGKVIFEDGANVDESTLTDTQKANLNGIKLLAEISSVEFHVFRSDKAGNTFKYTMPNGTVTSANGWFVSGTNQIWVDLNAGNNGEGTMIRTAAHEISHYIKQWSLLKWKAMADFLMSEFAKNGVNTESMLNRQIEKIKRRYRANKEAMPSEPELRDMAYEEVVCDALSDMLTDGSIVNFIAEVKAKDASLGRRILNAIKSLLKRWGLIIEDYKGRALDTAEAQALSQLEDVFKKLQEMYRDAFMDANETYTVIGNVSDGEIKNSSRNVDSKRKSLYNEYQTNAMQWAYSATTSAGDTKILSVNGRNFALLEATEDGYVEIARGNYKEVKELEQQYREPDDSVYVYSKIVRNAKTRNSSNNDNVENRREYEQGRRQTRSEGLQTDSTGNNEHLRTGDKGESEQQKISFSLRHNTEQAQKNTTDEGDVKMQARDLQKKDPTKLKENDLIQLLSYAKDKVFPDGTYIPVRINTPQILIAFAKEFGYSLENHPLAMRVYKARQALSNEENWDGNFRDKPHDLSPEEIIGIIRAMDNPSHLVYQTKNERFAEIVKFEKEGNKEKAYAVIDFYDVDKNAEIMNGYEGGKYNILVTIYPSEDVAELKTYLNSKENKVMTGEEIKKKGKSQRGLGSIVPAHLNESPFFEDSITQTNENIKENSKKFSDRDSSTSNRTILANSLESAAQNDIERNRLAQYKEKISKVEAEQLRLSEIQKKLFTKSGVESAKRK